MFWEAIRGADLAGLDRSLSYSLVLQHPDNRIVCHVTTPNVMWVDKCAIAADGSVAWQPCVMCGPPMPPMADWNAVRARLAELDGRFHHNLQGFVIKSGDGQRWKLRTESYNSVRTMRGNSPRRDFLWMKYWHDNKLSDYLTIYPEERLVANATVNRWKTATQDVYRIYCEAFKAHTLDRKSIPAKYRPLVYGLHSLYIETLKPAGKSVDWKSCVEFMNSKDPAQMLFVINWELRNAARDLGMASIPYEPPSVVGTVIAPTADAADASDAADAAHDASPPA
jgi:hypothetical protein